MLFFGGLGAGRKGWGVKMVPPVLQAVCSKTPTDFLIGRSYTWKIQGTGISKNSVALQVFFYWRVWSLFDENLFFYNYILRKFFKILVVEENPGTEKNPGCQDFKSSTETRIKGLFIEKIFQAIRAYLKSLPASYGTFKTVCLLGGKGSLL